MNKLLMAIGWFSFFFVLIVGTYGGLSAVVGVPGWALIYAGLSYLHVQHETRLTHAANAYFRLTGQVLPR